MKQIYQVTHVELQNLQPKSDVYLRVKMDISGRQSVWSHWVNVSMPPPCEFAKSLMRKLLASERSERATIRCSLWKS